MTDRTHLGPNAVFSPGTQVVTQAEVLTPNGRVAQPIGAVGVVVDAPIDREHAYRVRFPDGFETALRHEQIVQLAHHQRGPLDESPDSGTNQDLFSRVIFRCVIGSRAYGLEQDGSDTDRRGVFLPTARRHWSLTGVAEQIEDDATQESYWELRKCIVLALKANPNVLECLYSPLVEFATPLAEELLAMRSAFLSKLVYQTYNGYVMSQSEKMQGDIRNHGQVKWKHVMHLTRLLLAGIHVLREGTVPVRVDEHREELLAIRRGEMPWEQTEAWRRSLHAEFDEALRHTRLPERPDYERANEFLVKARRLAVEEALP